MGFEARDVTVRGVDAAVPFYVTPYLLTGVHDTRRHAAEAGGREAVVPREVGLDVRYGLSSNLTGDDYLTVQWAGTRNEGEAGSLADRSLARLFWERRTVDGLGYHLELTRSGPAYEPALGFEERDDFTSFKGRLAYG